MEFCAFAEAYCSEYVLICSVHRGPPTLRHESMGVSGSYRQQVIDESPVETM